MKKTPTFTYQQLMASAAECQKPKEISATVIISLHQWDKGKLNNHELCAILETVISNIRT